MLFYVPCGEVPRVDFGGEVTVQAMPELPGRTDLKFLDALPPRFVRGSTPSLAELAARPDVSHLGTPQPDPHQVSERVRVIVHGTDAALAAIVAKLMRIDALWIEVAYLPTSPATSPIARNWGLIPDASPQHLQQFARESAAQPTSLIRDDHGQVVLGAAEITGPGTELIGEAIVDSDVLYNHDPSRGVQSDFRSGIRMMPTMGAPGLVAVPLPNAAEKKGGWWKGWRRKENMAPPVLEGRALQAGGIDMNVTRDGVAHPRSLKNVTFYRHLRDAQFVRN